MRRALERQFIVGLSGFGVLFTLDHFRVTLGWRAWPYGLAEVVLYAMLPVFCSANVPLLSRFTLKHRYLFSIALSAVSWLIWAALEIVLWINLYGT